MIRLDSRGISSYCEVSGDLFSVQEGLIINCINADAHMGKGIAKIFDSKYPNDKSSLLSMNLRIGFSNIISDDSLIKRGYLVTKSNYFDKPTIDVLRSSLMHLFRKCVKFRIGKIYSPQIGCSLDKLNWQEVREIVVAISKQFSVEVQIFLYPPDGLIDSSVEFKEVDSEKKPLASDFVTSPDDISWVSYDDLRIKRCEDFNDQFSIGLNTYIDGDVAGYKDVLSLRSLTFLEEDFLYNLCCVLDDDSNEVYLVKLEKCVAFRRTAVATASDGSHCLVGLALVGY